MELTKAVIVVVGFLTAVCLGLPASKKDEVESVPPVRTYGDQPIVDTGVFSGWDNPFSSNPFGGLFGNLESIMERMRQQIASLLSRFPLTKSGNSTDIPSFPDVFQHPSLPDLSGIDLSKGNTTSITKVIDGHTVVINETEYKNEDDFGGTFFKVRIIDVKPDSSELTTEKEAEAVPQDQTPKDREEIANSIENEITKSKEVIDGHTVVINETEYKNEDDFGGTFFKVRIIDVKPDSSELTTEKEAEAVPQDQTPKDREEIANSIENEITKSKEAEANGTFENQDNIENLEKSDLDQYRHIETFDEVTSFENNGNLPVASTNQHSIESMDNRFSTNDEWFNEDSDATNSEWTYLNPVNAIDSNAIEETDKEYQRPLPIDLSRDTYVNEILAKNGAPVNPDAEVFLVENIRKPNTFEESH